jgi:hypothetical protein
MTMAWRELSALWYDGLVVAERRLLLRPGGYADVDCLTIATEFCNATELQGRGRWEGPLGLFRDRVIQHWNRQFLGFSSTLQNFVKRGGALGNPQLPGWLLTRIISPHVLDCHSRRRVPQSVSFATATSSTANKGDIPSRSP